MRKRSKNKCYDTDIGKELSSKRYLKSLSSVDSEYISELHVNVFDQFSGIPSVTELTNHSVSGTEDPDIANCGVVEVLPMLCNYIDKSGLLVRGLRHQIKMDSVYKYNYQLLAMYLSGEIDKIGVYCTEARGLDTDDLTAGRYVITISGYSDNKCKIHYEVITKHNYAMHPSRILKNIRDTVEKQKLTDVVEIDEESFNEAIKIMKTNNELDTEDKPIDDATIASALDLIDKKALSFKR